MQPIVIRQMVTVLRNNPERTPESEPFITITKAIEITIDTAKLFERVGKRAANAKSGRSGAIDGAVKARVVNRV